MLKSVPEPVAKPASDPAQERQPTPGGEFLRKLHVPRAGGTGREIIVVMRPDMPEGWSQNEKNQWLALNPISEVRCDMHSQKVTLVTDSDNVNLRKAFAEAKVITFGGKDEGTGTELFTMRLEKLRDVMHALADAQDNQARFLELAQWAIDGELDKRGATRYRTTFRR